MQKTLICIVYSLHNAQVLSKQSEAKDKNANFNCCLARKPL